MGTVTGGARLYIAVVTAAAVAVLLLTPRPPAQLNWWTSLGVLALLFGLCNSTPTQLGVRRSWSPSSSATLAAVVLLGPLGAALTGLAAVVSPLHQQAADRFFNGAMNVLSGFASAIAYQALGGPFGIPRPSDFPRIAGPFAVAAAVHVLANPALIWGVLRLAGPPGSGPSGPGAPGLRQAGPGARVRLESGLPLLLASDLGYAALGLVIAVLWRVMGHFAPAPVVVPLFAARWAMGQFAEQQKSYQATMAALCQAVETKDYYTRGHSERVSRGSGMIARHIGMRPDRVEAITLAGMLHDVGKLGVPTTVLQKTGPLTEEEFAAIQLHPMRGLEIVREIGFLTEALAGIMHHHERMDGRGYPKGFAGHEIPEFARIIAVADAFDSMTSTRSYRQARGIGEAVAELRKGAGTQFDPLLVDAFIAALAAEEWPEAQPPVIPPSREQVTVQDHDDPTAPLQVIESL